MLALTLRVGAALAVLTAGATAASARPHSHRHSAIFAHRSHAHYLHRHARSGSRFARHHRDHSGHGGDTASRSCLTPDTQALLASVEGTFGPVQVISTCRPGAVVAGTGHASQHRYGRAVDFDAPPGRKAAIVQWLAANNPGGTMTYAHMGHIHMDTGPRHFVSLGSGGRGHYRADRAYAAARYPAATSFGTSPPASPGTYTSTANSWYAANSGWASAYPSWSWTGAAAQDAVPVRHRVRYAHHRHHAHQARG